MRYARTSLPAASIDDPHAPCRQPSRYRSSPPSRRCGRRGDPHPYSPRPWRRAEGGPARPVTLADRAAETAMRRLIDAERSGTARRRGVRDQARRHSGAMGTRPDRRHPQLHGRPRDRSQLIALVDDGWPVLGVIDQPVQRERWIGVAGRPTLSRRPARTRSCAALEGAITARPVLPVRRGRCAAYMALVARSAVGRQCAAGPVYGGDCYNYGCSRSGHLDIVCDIGGSSHDFAALVPVVEGAGGGMCDWNGDPLDRRERRPCPRDPAIPRVPTTAGSVARRAHA